MRVRLIHSVVLGLKGQHIPAQGNALGQGIKWIHALKGQNMKRPDESANIVLPLQGVKN